MQKPGADDLLNARRAALAKRISFDEFLAKLTTKDRASAARRVAALDAHPSAAHGALWERLACTLMTLAPHAAKLVGKQTLQIYVADGKYRMQVFALEDLQDGNFTIYCPDVLDDAIRCGLLAPASGLGAGDFVTGGSKHPLRVDRLDGKSLNAAAHFKDLTGWNRTALRITLGPSPSAEQLEAAELICALAAQHFVPAAGPVERPFNNL
jgi:hypothetical protein